MELRRRLLETINALKPSEGEPLGRTRLAWVIMLVASQIKLIQGLEWVEEQLIESFDKHALASSLGVKEEVCYPSQEVIPEQKHIVRPQKSLQNIINWAFRDVNKHGRPSELQRDQLRAGLVHAGRRFHGLTRNSGFRYPAGVEAWLAAGDQAKGKAFE